MITAILLFPLLGFLINGIGGAIFGNRYPKSVPGIVGCASVLISFLIVFYSFLQFLQWPESWRVMTVTHFSWIPQLGVDFSLKLDPLSQLMALVVTGVGFFIHLYSVHYMKDDPSIARYFSFLNLFTFSMLLLVLANDLLLLFIGWEGVGLCSYLLIGFWFEDQEKASAGKKAFIVNRIGDLGFLLALLLTTVSFGTLNIESLQAVQVSQNQLSVLPMITLLFFMGACGKSAQIPLYVWLPDAMAGPTPVSALIHAATMVTAGVYMIARLHFLYLLAPQTMTIIAVVGISTALFSASMAFFENDIKKVLAYSTISQLGYMFLAVGIGAFSSGIFHLITHAFFKALLFLTAGSVIHALHHEQNIQNMGGLRLRLPLTHLSFLFGTLAIIGIPPLSGFFSKDEILWMAFNHHPVLWFFAWLGAMMTVFYMVRLFTIVFYGKEPSKNQRPSGHLHEAPPLMALALIVLSLFSALGGFIGVSHAFHAILPIDNFLKSFLVPVFSQEPPPSSHASHVEYVLMGFTILSTLAVSIWAFRTFHKNREWAIHMKIKFARVYKIISEKYYVDEAYHRLIIAPINRLSHFSLKWIDSIFIEGIINGMAKLSAAIGNRFSLVQNGNLQTYAFVFVIGTLAVFLCYWNVF